MKRPNVEFMIGWLDALRRDDLDSVRAALDRDIVWQGLRDDLVCHGPDQVVEAFATQRNANQEVHALELIGGERHAILHARVDLRELEGIPLHDGIYNVFSIEAGKVSRNDDLATRDQGPSPAQFDRA